MTMSVSAAARAIGCARDTFAKYEGGRQAIPPYIALACEALERRLIDKQREKKMPQVKFYSQLQRERAGRGRDTGTKPASIEDRLAKIDIIKPKAEPVFRRAAPRSVVEQAKDKLQRQRDEQAAIDAAAKTAKREAAKALLQRHGIPVEK